MITLHDGTDIEVAYTLDGRVTLPPNLTPLQKDSALAMVRDQIDDFFGRRP